jgi:molybdopterin-guanine dinucleotide biosynthesis protein A
MGRDKVSLEIGGESVLYRLVRRLQPICSGGVMVICRAGQELPVLPEGTRIEVDLLPGHAALGGLYTGLALAGTPDVFLAACDMPLLSAELVAWLRDLPGERDVLIPTRDELLEPLHAIYGQRCLGAIKGALLAGDLRMDGWLDSVRVERVAEHRWRQQHPSGHSFLNVNRPEDLELAILASEQPG